MTRIKRICTDLLIFGLAITLNSCGGDNTNSNQRTTTQSTPPVVVDNSPYAAGKMVYQKTCITCHQADGKGLEGTYPPLAGSDYLLANKYRAIRQVIKGSMTKITVNGKTYQGVMTPQPLKDSDIARVLTYVYHNFGNNGFDVSAGDVKSVRDTIK